MLFFKEPATYNVQVADDHVVEFFQSKGWMVNRARWGEGLDSKVIGLELATLFTTNFMVADEADLKAHPEKAAWKSDVIDHVAGGHALLTSPSTPEEEAAAEVIIREIWDRCKVTHDSPLNLVVAGMGLYVIERKVSKKRSGPVANGTPVPNVGRFVTSDFTMLRDGLITRELKKAQDALARLDYLLYEHGLRNPQYRPAIAQYTNRPLNNSVAALTWTDPKKVAEIIAAEEAARAAEAQNEAPDVEDEGGDEAVAS